jgi:hypothetical protein
VGRGSPAAGARHLRLIGLDCARSWLPCLPNMSIVRSAFLVRLESCSVCSWQAPPAMETHSTPGRSIARAAGGQLNQGDN